MRFSKLLLILFLLLPLRLQAAETQSRSGLLSLTLGESLRMALRKNFSIAVERFEPLIAREQVQRNLGRFDPVFESSYRRNENTARGDLLDGQRVSRNSVLQSDEWSTGLSGETPWGLSYDLGLSTRRDFGSDRPGDEFMSEAGLSLRQPLLRDFGTDANLAQVRIARNNVLVSEWQLRQRIIDILTTTVFVYNELQLAHENLGVAERTRGLARQLLLDNTKRAEIGVMSPIDITSARAEMAASEE
nr:TolC family protein [Verrucomicrobiota bacterium]